VKGHGVRSALCSSLLRQLSLAAVQQFHDFVFAALLVLNHHSYVALLRL
jgi:hypothetical protein